MSKRTETLNNRDNLATNERLKKTDAVNITARVKQQPWPDLRADFCAPLYHSSHSRVATNKHGGEKPQIVRRHSKLSLKLENREGEYRKHKEGLVVTLLYPDAQVSYCNWRFCPVHDNWAACRFSSCMRRHNWGEGTGKCYWCWRFIEVWSLRTCSRLLFFRDQKKHDAAAGMAGFSNYCNPDATSKVGANWQAKNLRQTCLFWAGMQGFWDCRFVPGDFEMNAFDARLVDVKVGSHFPATAAFCGEAVYSLFFSLSKSVIFQFC